MTTEPAGGPFRRRTVWLLGGAVALSLAALVAVSLFVGDIDRAPPTGPDAYSRSALGHHGLVALLERVGIPVVISQSHSAERARHGLLVVAEPTAGEVQSDRRLTDLVLGAPRVLLVLPKWWGVPSERHPGWLADVALYPIADVAAVLAALGIDRNRLERAETGLVASAASSAEGTVDVAIRNVPQYLTVDPEWDDPLLAVGDRALILDIPHGSTTMTVITDPDLINNHGLDEAGNAARVVELIDRLRQGGPVVFDEVSHGYVHEAGIWAVMFRYPLVLATIQALVCAIVLGLATRGRFGPPRTAAPPIAAGKEFLIRHTASLLRAGGHDAAILRRYLTSAVQQVRAALHAPRELTSAQAAAWLERVGAARKISVTLGELEREVAAVESDRTHVKRAAAIAVRIHRWRQEMTLGSGIHS